MELAELSVSATHAIAEIKQCLFRSWASQIYVQNSWDCLCGLESNVTICMDFDIAGIAWADQGIGSFGFGDGALSELIKIYDFQKFL